MKYKKIRTLDLRFLKYFGGYNAAGGRDCDYKKNNNVKTKEYV